MKHLKINTFLLTLLLSMAGLTAAAHDIEVKNEDDKTIYYRWTKNNTKLAVSYRGSSYDSYSNEYSGNVVIPESVTYNGVTYPVTSIGDNAFYYCSGLTSVTIPSSVTSIGSYAFYNCSSLTSVTISDLAAWCSIIFSSSSSNPLSYANHLYMNGEEVKDLVIPSTVTKISSFSLNGCSGLTSVDIPNSVTSIGSYAFSSCSGLTNVTIPNSVTSIGEGAFQSCSGLTSVTIPNSVTSIGGYAFSDCSGLTDVFCYAENVPTAANVFWGSSFSSATLHVPAASLSSYQTTEPWSGFGTIVALSNQCATPTIAFDNGEMTFDCETEGVEFVYSITMNQSDKGSKVSLKEMPFTYAVSVYATKEGWVDSDVATKTLTFQAKTGDVNGDGEITIADITTLINTILGDDNAAGSRAKVAENEEGR